MGSGRPEIINNPIKSPIAREVLHLQVHYLKIFGVAPKRILDVGCGNGLFLLAAQELGFLDSRRRAFKNNVQASH